MPKKISNYAKQNALASKKVQFAGFVGEILNFKGYDFSCMKVRWSYKNHPHVKSVGHYTSLCLTIHLESNTKNTMPQQCLAGPISHSGSNIQNPLLHHNYTNYTQTVPHNVCIMFHKYS